MTTPRYATLQDLRDYLSTSGNLGTTDDGLLNDCLLGAESKVDDYTRRNYAGTAGTYYVNRFGQGNVVGQALYLDTDLHSLTGVVNGDGQAIPTGSVWLEPRNEGPPYRVLRLKSSYVWVWNTDSDVIISGTFGYGTAAPEAVKRAVVRLAAYDYRLKDVGVGDVAGFSDGGEVTLPKGIPDDVKIALAPYRSRSGGVV